MDAVSKCGGREASIHLVLAHLKDDLAQQRRTSPAWKKANTPVSPEQPSRLAATSGPSDIESVPVCRYHFLTLGVTLEDQGCDTDNAAAVRAIDQGELQVKGVGSSKVRL
jgi:hypothetical protein